MTFSLAEVEAKQKVKVVSLGSANSIFRKKLLAMGLTPGIEIDITRKAPLGGPLELYLRGFSLSLRRNEALGIRVELLDSVG
ncbi:FeoA family protein [Aliikangiella maris]|uniref:FeoA family protein n=2 Tax=Aliikangiella maris TaxID=3162458 RepID=A0ABV3MK31_9GAMM